MTTPVRPLLQLLQTYEEIKLVYEIFRGNVK